MEKTLQAESFVFASINKGEIRIGNERDAEVLVDAANKFLANKNFDPRISVTQEELFCLCIYEWMSHLTDNGVSEEFLNKINDYMYHVRYQHLLMPSNDGPPHWQCIADMTNPDPAILGVFIFSNVLGLGGLANLKRCKMDDCKKFFIGRPNKDFCSKSCGSRFRVRKKRKRDIEYAISE